MFYSCLSFDEFGSSFFENVKLEKNFNKSKILCTKDIVPRLTSLNDIKEKVIQGTFWSSINNKKLKFSDIYKGLDEVIVISLQNCCSIDWYNTNTNNLDDPQPYDLDDKEYITLTQEPGKTAFYFHHYNLQNKKKSHLIYINHNFSNKPEEVLSKIAKIPITYQNNYGIIFISHCDGKDKLIGQYGALENLILNVDDIITILKKITNK